jgi:copper(I)-binding protein
MRTIPLAIAAALFAQGAAAQEFRAGAIAIGHPWTRPTPGTATPGVGYMTLENHGPEEDRLVAAASPSAVTVTMHRTEVTDGIARMLPQEGGIAIPAHGSARLEPGGLHLMLSGLKAPLALGQAVPLTLTFQKAGTVVVELKVERRPAAAAHSDHGAHQGAAH